MEEDQTLKTRGTAAAGAALLSPPSMKVREASLRPDLIRLSDMGDDSDSIRVTEYYFAADIKPRGMLTKFVAGPIDDGGWGE